MVVAAVVVVVADLATEDVSSAVVLPYDGLLAVVTHAVIFAAAAFVAL